MSTKTDYARGYEDGRKHGQIEVHLSDIRETIESMKAVVEGGLPERSDRTLLDEAIHEREAIRQARDEVVRERNEAQERLAYARSVIASCRALTGAEEGEELADACKRLSRALAERSSDRLATEELETSRAKMYAEACTLRCEVATLRSLMDRARVELKHGLVGVEARTRVMQRAIGILEGSEEEDHTRGGSGRPVS